MNTALLISVGLLWLLVLVLTAVVFALVRQIGVLHERIAPVGALLLRQGLEVGKPAPAMQLQDLSGAATAVGGARADGKSTLLVFVSPTCPVCKALLPVLRATASSERKWAQVILASDGKVEEQRAYVAAQNLQSLPYVVSAELGMAYQVSRLPFAAIIDSAGVLRARGLINSREHLESLFEAAERGVASLQEFFAREAHTHAA